MSENRWIVINTEKDQRIKLVSKYGTEGVLPKGSYLTVIDEKDDNKPLFILCVEDSYVEYPYGPSSFIVDMDLDGIQADLKWQNIILARKIRDLNKRDDGLINLPKLRSIARRSNQEEINLAMDVGVDNPGPEVFLATIYDNENRILVDDEGKFLHTCLKDDFIFYQTMVVGKTGSGKTVATKYLAQYFIEKTNDTGCVLAVNVKDVDFLKMYEASNDTNSSVLNEWDTLGKEAHPVKNFRVYYPANITISLSKRIDNRIIRPIALDVKTIEPEALTGLLQSISDIGAQNLPDIFRAWRDEISNKRSSGKGTEVSFNNFVLTQNPKKIYLSFCAVDNSLENKFLQEKNLPPSMLADIPLVAAENAIAAHVSTNPFPPSIAEIRGWVINGSDSETGVEAWGRIMEAMRKYGSYEPKKARAYMGEEIWGVMQGVFPSWQHLCMSENAEADRAHFIKAWDSLLYSSFVRLTSALKCSISLE